MPIVAKPFRQPRKLPKFPYPLKTVEVLIAVFPKYYEHYIQPANYLQSLSHSFFKQEDIEQNMMTMSSSTLRTIIQLVLSM